MKPKRPDHDLHQQHVAYLRAGYDGHNRKPIATTTGTASKRRRRREAKRRHKAWLPRMNG